MERYLSFGLSDDDARHSDFSSYTLGDSSLLPLFFGDVAPINIFLGENNSGKSRFMREIMRQNPTKFINFGHRFNEHIRGIESTLRKIDGIRPSDIYNLLITTTDKTSNETLSFFCIDKRNNKAHNFQFNGNDSIIFITSTIKLINDLSREKEKFLAYISDDESQKLLSELESHVIKLKTLFAAYRTFKDNKVPGFYLNTVSGKQAYFDGPSITIQVNTEYDASPFYQIHYRDRLADEIAPLLLDIATSCDRITRFLSPLIRTERLDRTRTYIPTLRTARTILKPDGSKVQEDILEATISKDYDLKKADVIVRTGLSLFTDIDEKVNSEINDREEFERFQDFLSETFFNGRKVRVVPNRKKVNILVAVDREERALPHLGDGIQAIILLLYPIFIASNNAWFFIEEPETHLHPGFQRLFIKTLATHPVILEKNLTVFMTTHSNHLLDFAQEEEENINLFTFRKTSEEDGHVSYQIQLTAPHDLECLNVLGVQNSSVFLSNCTIWVEGITDRIYLKAYLAIYLEYRKQTFSLLEGLHYSFLEYAGANISHYTFGTEAQQVTITEEALKNIQSLSISNRIMLIADQDTGKETKHQRLTSQQHAGFEYIVIPTREIENLLTPQVIVSTLERLYPKHTEHFDVNQLKQVQYKSIYLAKHLKSKFSELPDSFVGKSGTVSSAKKRPFAEAASKVITSWEMLSPEAQKLTKQVFQFIMGHNPRLGSN